MEWEPSLLQIIDTPAFQRLRRIKQLGVCHLVFPGATHTRFEHSLGVGFLAAQFAKTLLANQPGCLHSTTIKDDARIVRVLQAAGLCHDLGHGPVSHAFDNPRLVEGLDERNLIAQPHEARSSAIFRHIVESERLPFTAEDVDIVCELISPAGPGSHAPEVPESWRQIISSDVDADKLDYLQRDSLMIGIPSCGVDVQRFFAYARVIGGRICYAAKTRFDIIQLFAARHRLHAQAYQHPAVRALEHMHVDYMRLLMPCIEPAGQTVDGFCGLTDDVLSQHYLELCRGQIGDEAYAGAVELRRRIQARQLYRLVSESRIPPEQIDGAAELARAACQTAAAHELVDVGVIGYKRNPLLDMHFYTAKDPEAARTLTLCEMSAMITTSPLDMFMRVYSRS